MASERVQTALEHLAEDGALTEDLPDTAAAALLAWAEAQIVAADDAAADAAFKDRVRAIRAALRAAAKADPAADVVAVAEAALQPGTTTRAVPPSEPPAAAPPAADPAAAAAATAEATRLLPPAPAVETVAALVPSPPAAREPQPELTVRPHLQSWRRRLRNWIHRKV